MDKDEKKKSLNKISSILPILIGAILGAFGGIYSSKFNLSFGNALLDLFFLFIIYVLSFFVQTILHEGGHLIFGLLSNYEFISFRIGSLTLIKEGNKLLFKKFKISGTAGQCLMMPKVDDYKKSPYILYNLGGVLMNLLTSILCLYLCFHISNKYINLSLIALIAMGICTFILNGIPMKISGIANDGYNLISIGKDDLIKYCFYTQLKVNGLLSKGVKIEDMDKSIFEIDESADFSNPLVTSIKCLENNYYTYTRDFKKSKEICEFLLNYNPKIVKLYENEIKCDLLFSEIMTTCNMEIINKLYDKNLQKYIKATDCYVARKRLMYAYALLVEKEEEKADKLLKEFQKVQNTYPLKGEIESEIELVNYISTLKDCENK